MKLARACGIEEEELLEEDGTLRYIHKHYGTLLYYPKVAGVCGKVICDPNIILHPSLEPSSSLLPAIKATFRLQSQFEPPGKSPTT